MNDRDAVVVLAGGRATRFPGKLAHDVGGETLLERACRNASAAGIPVYLAGSATFTPSDRPNLPLLEDRWPGGGPLRALFSACRSLQCDRIFALAGDEPNAGAALFAALNDAWQPGDEAVVPRHGSHLEPLAALYSRRALLREAEVLLAQGRDAMHALVERLHARTIDVPAATFANVNARADLGRVAKAATP